MTPLEQAALEFATLYFRKLVTDGPDYPMAHARDVLQRAALRYAREKAEAYLNKTVDT